MGMHEVRTLAVALLLLALVSLSPKGVSAEDGGLPLAPL